MRIRILYVAVASVAVTILLNAAGRYGYIRHKDNRVKVLQNHPKHDCDVETCDIHIGDYDWSLDRYCV